ncbi:MAG: MOSC domain-containing protein [Pseudomonadales bacterium]|nr:MOSC domain-containing protein [Pseudomonadales bacterium]
MNAKILEVCVGMPQEIEVNGKQELSGIFKSPVEGPVELSLTNLTGDGQANLKFHGGREKAVYVYSANHYGFWRNELVIDSLEASQFGQNLTVDGFPDDEVRIGDQFQLGTAVATVAQPRIPCAKLGVRVGDPEFTNRFLMAGYLGYYLYVDEPGALSSGDSMTMIKRADRNISVRDLWQTVFTTNRDAELAAAALEFPYLDEGWKKRLRKIVSDHDNIN